MVSEKVSEKVAAHGRVKWPGAPERERRHRPRRRAAHGHVKWPGAPEREILLPWRRASHGHVKWPGAPEREILLPWRRVAHGHVKWPGAPERETTQTSSEVSQWLCEKAGVGHESPLLTWLLVGDVVRRVS